jgi:glutamine synthetase
MSEPKLPTIATMTVKSDACDEWYGVEVRVTWKEPFDYPAYSRWVKEEQDAYWKANPKAMRVGPWERERVLRDHVVRQVLARPEWEAYYATPHRVRCEQYEDGPERVVTIPRFNDQDFSDWSFSKDGGWLAASDR